MWGSIVKQYSIPESCGKQLLVHKEESNYYSVLRITRVSSTHWQMDRNLTDSLLFLNGPPFPNKREYNWQWRSEIVMHRLHWLQYNLILSTIIHRLSSINSWLITPHRSQLYRWRSSGFNQSDVRRSYSGFVGMVSRVCYRLCTNRFHLSSWLYFCLLWRDKTREVDLVRHFFVYFESIKRELRTRPIHECRDDD